MVLIQKSIRVNERIRVPEVVFQPSIAGVDQAGLIEIMGDILNQRLGGLENRDDFLKDVFLTGGNTMFRNFEQRLRDGLTALLPADAPLKTRHAKDPLLDAWRGAAAWSGSPAWKAAAITKDEYFEKGSEYLKVCPRGRRCLYVSDLNLSRSTIWATAFNPIASVVQVNSSHTLKKLRRPWLGFTDDGFQAVLGFNVSSRRAGKGGKKTEPAVKNIDAVNVSPD